MDVTGNTPELGMAVKTGARIMNADPLPVPADRSTKVLQEVIGRNVMSWISAGVAHPEVEASKISNGINVRLANHAHET